METAQGHSRMGSLCIYESDFSCLLSWTSHLCPFFIPTSALSLGCIFRSSGLLFGRSFKRFLLLSIYRGSPFQSVWFREASCFLRRSLHPGFSAAYRRAHSFGVHSWPSEPASFCGRVFSLSSRWPGGCCRWSCPRCIEFCPRCRSGCPDSLL